MNLITTASLEEVGWNWGKAPYDRMRPPPQNYGEPAANKEDSDVEEPEDYEDVEPAGNELVGDEPTDEEPGRMESKGEEAPGGGSRADDLEPAGKFTSPYRLRD